MTPLRLTLPMAKYTEPHSAWLLISSNNTGFCSLTLWKMALLVDVVSQSITWLRSPEFHSTMLSGDTYMREEQIHVPPLMSE